MSVPGLSPPVLEYDLIDYESPPPPPGQPCGALVIPPLDDIIQYVFKVARGKSFDFPIVLDEH